MLQCDTVRCSVIQCVAVCCSVLQCDAVCCSVMQCDAVHCSNRASETMRVGFNVMRFPFFDFHVSFIVCGRVQHRQQCMYII